MSVTEAVSWKTAVCEYLTMRALQLLIQLVRKFVPYPTAQHTLIERTNEYRWGHDELPDKRLKQQEEHKGMINT